MTPPPPQAIGPQSQPGVDHGSAGAGGENIHEALLATLIIFGFSLGVVSFYFAVICALGQCHGIF